jgi:SAM-dependent methyltransferase
MAVAKNFIPTSEIPMWTRIKRALQSRIVKKWGTSAAKRLIWNKEFGSGQWEFLEHTTTDPIYALLESYSCGGSILDLGCGSGNTGNELNSEKYETYTGVDISEIAVLKAQARTKENRREAKNHYLCADIETYVPDKKYDVIAFRESIFYIPATRIRQVLERYSSFLYPKGVFIVRIFDRNKHRNILEKIQKYFLIIDEHLVGDAKDIIVVFRARSQQ